MTLWIALLFVASVAANSIRDAPPVNNSAPDPDPLEEAAFDGGDLILTKKQKALLYGNRAGFAAAYQWADPWTNGKVPYQIRNDFSSSYVAEIKESMRIWERDTCIRFVERSNEKSYIRIQDGRVGCNSYLGDINREGGQPLNLKVSGCMAMGTYLHEFGHALGLVHEHQRPDRDDYLRYHGENVQDGKHDQLKKYQSYYIKKLGTKFDISSIMLYSLNAFSKDRDSLQTLSVENTFMEKHINGRRYRHLLSFGDIKTINKLYKCHTRCKKDVNCPEPGFVNERCECVTIETYLAQRCKDDPKQKNWCDKKARRGLCERTDAYQQRHCMKSCDFCPIFAPGTSGLVKREGCVNHYSDTAKCDQWAKAGICKSYPSWMERHCRKSCHQYTGTCDKDVGVCANKLSDNECDGYRDSWWDYCKSKKDWGKKARRECPDSCKVCPK